MAQDVDSTCEVCGAVPALRVELRAVTGLVIAFRITTQERVVCRACGTALYREEMDNTLMKGWWGLFAFFVNLWAIAVNYRAGQRLAALGEPSDWERPEGPLDPGPPLRKRRGTIVAAVIGACIVLLVAASAFGADDESIDVTELPGQCVDFTGPDEGIEVVDCSGPHDAQVINVVDNGADCSRNAEVTLRLDMEVGDDKFACLDED